MSIQKISAISLYCAFRYKHDLKKGVVHTFNLSGVCDSTGSITGNNLGPINRPDAIPEEWVQKLRYNQIVTQVAKDLHCSTTGNFTEPVVVWWRRYSG